jgi:hypothetical protein
MAKKILGKHPATLHPFELDDEALFHLGRLVRACAELEEALTYFITVLTKADEGVIHILIGKTPFGQRKRIAEELVKDRGNEKSARVMAVFKSFHLEHAFTIRNCGAHGVLLGATEDGHIAFRTNDPINDPLAAAWVYMTRPDQFQVAANNARYAVQKLDPVLGLQALRERLRSKPLDPGGTNRRRTNMSEAQPPPPQSSEG